MSTNACGGVGAIAQSFPGHSTLGRPASAATIYQHLVTIQGRFTTRTCGTPFVSAQAKNGTVSRKHPAFIYNVFFFRNHHNHSDDNASAPVQNINVTR